MSNKKPVKELWNEASAPNTAGLEHVVELWKQTVAVQMHFNDICMKIRNLAISVLVGALGLGAYATKEGYELDVPLLYGARSFSAPASAAIACAGLIGWTAFWAMDRHWYHNFLRAAGTHAGHIEHRWRGTYPEFLLSSQIRENSTSTEWFGKKFNSNARLDLFYLAGFLVLTLALFVFGLHPHLHAIHDQKQLPVIGAAPSTGLPPASGPVKPAEPSPVQEPAKE